MLWSIPMPYLCKPVAMEEGGKKKTNDPSYTFFSEIPRLLTPYNSFLVKNLLIENLQKKINRITILKSKGKGKYLLYSSEK